MCRVLAYCTKIATQFERERLVSACAGIIFSPLNVERFIGNLETSINARHPEVSVHLLCHYVDRQLFFFLRFVDREHVTRGLLLPLLSQHQLCRSTRALQ